MNAILGLDVGGTKLAAGLVRADGSLIAHEMRPTIAQGSAQDLWEDVVDLIETVLAGVSAGIVGMDDAGRWALARGLRPAHTAKPNEAVEHIARALLRRYGVVFWRLLEREASWLPQTFGQV